MSRQHVGGDWGGGGGVSLQASTCRRFGRFRSILVSVFKAIRSDAGVTTTLKHKAEIIESGKPLQKAAQQGSTTSFSRLFL